MPASCSSVRASRGVVQRVSVVKYSAPVGLVTTEEQFTYNLIERDTKRLIIPITMDVDVKPSLAAILAEDCLRLWGLSKGVNDLEFKLETDTTPRDWLDTAKAFEGTQEQVVKEIFTPLSNSDKIPRQNAAIDIMSASRDRLSTREVTRTIITLC